jgi:hypothetical protein
MERDDFALVCSAMEKGADRERRRIRRAQQPVIDVLKGPEPLTRDKVHRPALLMQDITRAPRKGKRR